MAVRPVGPTALALCPLKRQQPLSCAGRGARPFVGEGAVLCGSDASIRRAVRPRAVRRGQWDVHARRGKERGTAGRRHVAGQPQDSARASTTFRQKRNRFAAGVCRLVGGFRPGLDDAKAEGKPDTSQRVRTLACTMRRGRCPPCRATSAPEDAERRGEEQLPSRLLAHPNHKKSSWSAEVV